MPEITRPGGAPGQSIAPATTAPTAPTITAPGAPTVTSPVSASSYRREQAMRKSFAETKERFGRSRYLSKARKDEIQPTPAPATPVSDAYIITMRPKDAAPKRREMLDDLVVREEQRKREDWLRAEEVRAAVLPHQLQAEIQYAAQLEYINKVSQEHAKAVQERQARDAEAAKYGYSSYEALQQAIREEKAIKRANELGYSLTEAQQIAQTIAREGYSGAAIQYGRDPQEMIAELTAQAEAAQRSLRENFGVEADPSHGDYLRDISKFAAEQRQISASIQQTARSSGIVDQDTGLRIVSAGPPLKTSDYPSPPKGLNQSVARLTKNADGTGWNVEAGIVAPSPVPNADDRSELERTLQTHPFLLSPFGRLVQDIWDDRKEIAQAEVDVEEAYKRYEERRKAAEDAGLLVGDEFLISDPRSQIQFDELRISAETAQRMGKEVEDLQKKELFGIPYKFNEWETGLAKTLNLPKMTREQAFGLTRLQNPIISQIPVIAEFRAGVLYGAYSGIRDRPLTGLASFGIGLVGGAAVKGATMLPKAGKIVPPALKLAEAAWVGSIGARTALSPDFFSAGETFGGIMTTEALPVAAGATAIQQAPGALTTFRGLRQPRPTNPPVRQDVFDVTGELPSLRDVAQVGPTRIYGAETEFPAVRKAGEVHGLDIYGTEMGFPTIREVAQIGPTRIYGAETEFPAVRKVGEVHGLDIYGTEMGFPTIREAAQVGPTRIYDATGAGGPDLLGSIDAAPKPSSRAPSKVRAKRGDTLTLYTPEALGAKQRATMAQRRAARIEGGPVPRQSIQILEAPKISSVRLRPTAPASRTALGLASIGSIVQDRDSIKDIGLSPVQLPRVKIDTGVAELEIPTQADAQIQTPSPDQIVAQAPDLADIVLLRQDQIIQQVPRQTPLVAPRVRPGRRNRPLRPRPPRIPPVWPEDQRRASFGDEFYLHAADLPTPHARLEEAYTNLRDPKIRPAKIIRNLQRITIGSPPRTPRRAITVQTATVRKTPHRVPWDIPAVRPIDVVFGQKKKKKKSRRRR